MSNLRSNDTSGVRRFVTKHETAFTLLGAFIVFWGFFVKEGIRETSHDLAVSLDAAQTSYLVLADLKQITTHFERERTNVRNAKLQRTSPGTLDDLFNDESTIQRTFDEQKGTFYLTERLFAKLPVKPQKFLADDRKIRDEVQKFESVGEDTSHKMDALDWDDPGYDKTVEDMERRLVSVRQHQIVQVVGDVFDFNEEIVDLAEKEQEQQERREAWASIGSYGLFAFGWALGLTAKLLRLPVLAPIGGE
ncbi:MAG TPA: hypothetical protein VMF91_07485 [Bryobacteraceae bacterium]|nr:hypothetical protein [Bryobacteraceae bacterium]